jgi:hypothetical protein
MEERIASDKNKCRVVKLGRAQNNGSAPVEGSTFMPSDKAEILRLFPQLTDEEQAVILDLIKSLLSGQESSVAAPVSIGR